MFAIVDIDAVLERDTVWHGVQEPRAVDGILIHARIRLEPRKYSETH